MMTGRDMVYDSEQRWAINIEWLTANNRSFISLAKGSMCSRCRKKLKVNQGGASTADVLKALKACCSRSDDFMRTNLPIQESLFRIFLANGNQPLTLDQIGRQLMERRGIDAYRTPGPTLRRLLVADQHYGLRPVMPSQ